MILCSTVTMADTIVPAGVQSMPNMCTIIPSGTMQFIAMFEPTTYNCDAGYFLGAKAFDCAICPENHYCPGGAFMYSETDVQGMFECASGTFSPIGMWENTQCGRRFHVDDEIMFLRATKQTEHALHIDINGDGVADFFANLTTADVPIHKDSSRKLKIKIDGVVYSAYDDTVNPNEQSEVTE